MTYWWKLHTESFITVLLMYDAECRYTLHKLSHVSFIEIARYEVKRKKSLKCKFLLNLNAFNCSHNCWNLKAAVDLLTNFKTAFNAPYRNTVCASALFLFISVWRMFTVGCSILSSHTQLRSICEITSINDQKLFRFPRICIFLMCFSLPFIQHDKRETSRFAFISAHTVVYITTYFPERHS